MAESFDTLYNRLEPVLEQLEERRRTLKSQGVRNGLIAAATIGAVGLALIPTIKTFSLIIFVAAVFAFLIFVGSKSAEVTAFYKKHIVSQVVDGLLPDAVYRPEWGVSEQLFCHCGLFSTVPDRYSSEDGVIGRVGKTDLRFSEVHAEERHVSVDSKGRRREYWTDIFNGFLFEADFHKEFRGHTVLYRDALIKFRLGERRVKLENEAFERCFDVYSTDEVEARYILSPSMMERLVALNDRLNGGITLSFYQSKVYIALPDSTNHFEASIWKRMTREKIEEEFRTVHDLIGIVDVLNLNTRIWTKE